jgi:hypothetical protein
MAVVTDALWFASSRNVAQLRELVTDAKALNTAVVLPAPS